MMTFFLDTSAARGQTVRQEMASRDLDISWRKETAPPPPEPRRIKPADPTVTPVSLDRLLREFEAPKATPPTKSKSCTPNCLTTVTKKYKYPVHSVHKDGR